MGLKSALENKKVYFDSNIFIYLLEGSKEFSELLLDIRTLVESRSINVFSSSLVYTELIPPHAKQENFEGISSTINFLNLFNLITPSGKILIHAGMIRGSTAMKTPDAIHVATAMASGCDLFLSNDKNIRMPESLEKVLLADYLDG